MNTRRSIRTKEDAQIALSLVCPYCKQSLFQTPQENLCKNCNEIFPIAGDIHYFISDAYIGTTQKRMVKYYRKASQSYNIRHGSSLYGTSYNIKKYYQRLFDKYITGVSTMLEFGAGTGRFSCIFRNYAKTFYVSDLSPQMLEENNVNSDFKACADTTYLPFKNNLFDCVAGMTTFSYIPDKDIALKEIKRIVKNGGVIFIIDQNAKSFMKTLGKYYYYYARKTNRVRALHDSSLDSMKQLFAENDIELLESGHFSFIPHALPKLLTILLVPFDWLFSLTFFTKKQAMRYYIIGRVKK